jgi:hypothetical protein
MCGRSEHVDISIMHSKTNRRDQTALGLRKKE